MKKYLSIFVLLFSLFTVAQEVKQEPLAYTQVVEVKDVSKDDLYNRAKMWFSKNLKNTRYVVDFDDKASGQIIAKSNVDIYQRNFWGTKIDGKLRFVMKLFFKDGKYKFVVTDFTHEPDKKKVVDFGLLTTSVDFPREPKGNRNWYNENWKHIKVKALNISNLIFSSLEAAMEKPIKIDNDW